MIFLRLTLPLLPMKKMPGSLFFPELKIATAAWPDAEGNYRFSRPGHWPINPEKLTKSGYKIVKIVNDFEACTAGILKLDTQALTVFKSWITGPAGRQTYCRRRNRHRYGVRGQEPDPDNLRRLHDAMLPDKRAVFGL